MHEVDVVVIGAGAAGLAAGEALAASGFSFAVLEAKSRIGGRAWTDERIFPGIPFDRGCHWLHSASRNPFREAADRLGVAYETRGSRRSASLYLDGARATSAEATAAWVAVYAAFVGGEAAGATGRDVAAESVCDTTGPWWPLARHWMTLLSSLPPERISTLDLAAYADTGENWPVVEGYGALVARVAAGVPVHLDVAVRAIDRTGARVAVTTNRGALSARCVILTVSTNVLTGGAIRMTPQLPDAVLQAAADCPLGVAEKVAFLLDAQLADVANTSYIDTMTPASPARAPINFVLNHFGHPVIVAQMCGETARGLQAEGEAAMVDFALAALKDCFGADIGRRIRRATATHWTTDAHVGGAYSCALPGRATARAVLRQGVDERVLLAGEAVSATAYSTAHGARESGLAAARRACEALA